MTEIKIDEAASPTDQLHVELLEFLRELGERVPELPTWEWLDGALAALVCCRGDIPMAEYLPLLMRDENGRMPFANLAETVRFERLWMRRWNQVVEQLDAELDDATAIPDGCLYEPHMVDWRGALLMARRDDPGAADDTELGELPDFGEVWADGFMSVVEIWPEEWVRPRDKELARELDAGLKAVAALLHDEADEAPVHAQIMDDGTPSTSREQFRRALDAAEAVAALRFVGRELGPRVPPRQVATKPGRNDPCPCGSGKKYKKCCGAG